MSNVKPGRAAVLAPGTHTGRTWSGRAVGSCGECGAGIAVDGEETRGRCPGCGALVTLRMVYGERSDVPCDDRCMGAVGPDCSCACGGANHGRWCLKIELVPVFERDKARAVQAKRTRAHAERAARKAQARDAARAALLAAHPELADVMGDRYAGRTGFVGDMRDAITSGRELTGRQVDALVAMVRRDRERDAAQAARDRADADARAAGVQTPAGRLTITGVIVSAKVETDDRFSYHGKTDIKITVLTSAGWRAWGTLPRAAYPRAYTGETLDAWRRSLPGREITLTATIKPHGRDQLFGYFKRPHAVTIGPVPAGRPAPMCEACGFPPHADGDPCPRPGDQAAPADADQAAPGRYVYVPARGMWAGPMTAGEAYGLASGYHAADQAAHVYPGDTRWTSDGQTRTVAVVAAEWQAARDAADRERYADADANPADPAPAAPAEPARVYVHVPGTGAWLGPLLPDVATAVVDGCDADGTPTEVHPVTPATDAHAAAWRATRANPPADPGTPASGPVTAAAGPFTSAWAAPADPDPAPFVSAWSL